MSMSDSLDVMRRDLQDRLHALRSAAPRLSPLTIHRQMDAIRSQAEMAGLSAMEGLAGFSAQLALLPGCKTATRACLDHAGDALGAATVAERQAVMAAIAVRLN